MELQKIRENEKRSHTLLYMNSPLYSVGSWLKKPVKTVMEILPLFDDYTQIHILDLGCGVGRNSIAIARCFSSIPCRADCVDILEIAIQKLMENAKKYQVANAVHGIVSPIENFSISPSGYDLILAVSALEHIDSEISLISKLNEIKAGIKKNGIVCLIMNTQVQEFDKETGKELSAQFEVNLPTDRLLNILQSIFSGWAILKQTKTPQHYKVPRDSGPVDLYTTVITLVARK